MGKSKTKRMWHFFGFHDILTYEETGEIKFEYQSAFDLMITKYTQYKCSCGSKIWMPKGSFLEEMLREKVYRSIMLAVKELERRGEYDEAIQLLKLYP